MGHMVTVEEAKGKRDRVRGKAFFPLPENFFIFLISRVKWGGGGGFFFFLGVDALLSFFFLYRELGCLRLG